MILGGFVLPLGLDTLALATALGLAGLTPRQRLRVTALFTAFEMGMPLLGLLAGQAAGSFLGRVAGFVAIGLLAAIGVYILWPKNEDAEQERVRQLASTGGIAVVGLGLSISLDELAIGFTLGLLRQPLALVILLIGAQALVMTQVGLRLGSRLGEAFRDGAERLAGLLLILLAALLLLEQLMRS